MIRKSTAHAFVAAALFLTTASVSAETPSAALAKAVDAFLEDLDPVKRENFAFPFDHDARQGWSFFPGPRAGIRIGDLQALQQEQVLDILRTGLSATGFEKAENIRSLEEVLGRHYNPGHYFVTLFGTPGDDALAWGLRWEGHHLSLNWTIVDGKVVASTPQFLGANPAEVRSGPRQGERTLAAEEDLARALLAALSPEQRAVAVISDTAPRDILTAMDREAAIQENLGIAYGDLDEDQQAILMELVETYAEVQRPELRDKRLARLRDAGLDTIKFAWMGGTEPGEGHYYRVQGNTFLIEYDNVQDNANHIHTVWRDFDGDFGRDVLKEHYRAHADDHGHGHHGHDHDHGHSHDH